MSPDPQPQREHHPACSRIGKPCRCELGGILPQIDPQPRPAGEAQIIDRAAGRAIREVAELPDRTSPDDWPEAMLVTSVELDRIVQAVVREALADAQAQAATNRQHWNEATAELRALSEAVWPGWLEDNNATGPAILDRAVEQREAAEGAEAARAEVEKLRDEMRQVAEGMRMPMTRTALQDARIQRLREDLNEWADRLDPPKDRLLAPRPKEAT